MVEFRISKDPDGRTLKQILDSINEVAVRLDYLDCRSIQEDIAEIWDRYGYQPTPNELVKAIKILTKNYARGHQLVFVRNPLAWSLYQTWKQFDGEWQNNEKP